MSAPHPARRALLLAALLTLAAAAVVVFALAGSRRPASAPSNRGAGAPAPTLALVTREAGAAVPVPASFLGISTEYWTVPVWNRQLGLLERVFGLLSIHGAIRLRIGGDSADRVQWSPTRELPEWVFELAPAWLRQTSQIVRRTHAKVILDLNLVTSTPALAARWAKAAVAGLPPGSITAFEIGNEPDIYSRSAWTKVTAGPGAAKLPSRITAASYARSFGAYADALRRVAPGIPLLAPALAEPQKNYGWVSTLLNSRHPGLAGITVHRYPYSACAKPGSATFPTIERVLSEHATVSMGRTALAVEHISDRARLPLWLTEINSVTCGGTRGVSNTFATALWAPDALFELVRAGVESASVHVRDDAINMAFSLTPHGLVAFPLFYGMLLFERTLGPGARLIPVRVSAPAALHLKAWMVGLAGGEAHVLLLDKGPRPARVRLRLPLAGAAKVARLTAPSITSAQVTLGGQYLTSSSGWAGRPHSETVPRLGRDYVITVPRFSGALVTARLLADY